MLFSTLTRVKTGQIPVDVKPKKLLVLSTSHAPIALLVGKRNFINYSGPG